MAPLPWTEADDAALRQLLPTMGFADVAIQLGRTRRACETRASVIGVSRGLRKPWTAAEVAELRRLFPTMSNPELADLLGRSETAVKEKAVVEGLRKSTEYMSNMYGRRRTPPTVRASTAPRKRTASVFLQGRAGRFDRDAGAYTPTDDAVRHLQRLAPIWRCDADGTTNPKGDHWKFSGKVMDAAAVEARAKRSGWVRP